MQRKLLLVLVTCLVICFSLPAAAQNFTNVTATVHDSSGLPYANAQVDALCVGCNASPIAGQAVQIALTSPMDATGTFSMTVARNAVVGGQWQFTIRSAGLPIPIGFGPVTFSVTLTINGASQDISANLNGVAPALSRISSGNAFSNGLGSGYQDVTEISTPANPAAGNDRLYLSTATHQLACLTSSGGNCNPTGGGGSGTVTSVALTVPAWLTVGGSPVTTSGTLAVTAATGQTSHQVIGTCGAATSFGPCALVAGDLPSTVVMSITNDTNVTGSIAAQNLTLGWTGQLSIGRGGTGAATQQAALNALMPGSATAGSFAYYNGTNWVLFAGNTSGTTCLQETPSGVPSWASGTCPNPMNTLGDMIYENSTPSAARLPGPTAQNIPYILTSTPSAGVAQAPVWSLPGVPINAQIVTSYTIGNSDRETTITTSNGSPIAITVPQAGTGSFTNNFTFALANINTGLVTMTPTISTVNGVASIIVPNHWYTYWYSDNTNYFSGTFPDIAAFPSCGSGALGFTTATGVFSCNTFATLAPTPTRAGDVIYYNGTNWVTLAGNNSGTQFLQESALGVPSWASGSSTVALSAITAAAGTNSINSGNNAQTWNWSLTGAAVVGMAFTENVASTTGTAKSQAILQVSTLLGSTATPLIVNNSLNGSQVLPALYVNPTWNTSGVVDAAILVNVTNTASGAGSLLLDLQVGGTSEFSLDKAGNLKVSSFTTVHGLLVGEGAAVAVAQISPGTANQILKSGGAGGDPVWTDSPDVKMIPAANCNNATGGPGWSIGSGGTATCRAGTNNLGGFISISDTSTTFATFQIAIPEDWDSASNPFIRLQLASTDATNGHTIIPEINVACYKGDGSTTDDVAPNGFHSLSTVTLNGNANRFWSTSNVQMNSTDMTGCSAGSLMQITVGRATDTATNAEFYSATITFPRLIVAQAN